MRWILIIIGAVMLMTGGVWFTQGIGILLGSPMTSQPFWAVAGGLVFIFGLIFLLRGIRRRA